MFFILNPIQKLKNRTLKGFIHVPLSRTEKLIKKSVPVSVTLVMGSFPQSTYLVTRWSYFQGVVAVIQMSPRDTIPERLGYMCAPR